MKKEGVHLELFFDKKGQLTIFIIVGVVIVSFIGLFLIFRGTGLIQTGGGSEENPESFFKSCIEDDLRNSVRDISLKGGYDENPLNRTFEFTEDGAERDIGYLCYTQNNYRPCTNQRPTLISDFDDEIENLIESNVQTCFDEMISTFNEKGYSVNPDYNGFNVEVLPNIISVKTNSEVSITESGETQTYKNIKANIPSRTYSILQTTQEILNQEAKFCDFDSASFMITYPEFRIQETKSYDSTLIYTIEHKDTNEIFRFAVRGCAVPDF